MAAPFFGLDVFTSNRFGGNPAAVCLLDTVADSAWMQQVAAEFNQPATAFLWINESLRQLRWFTPVQELPLCGHATLATAHALYETGRASPDDPIDFHTQSGVLTVWRRDRRVWLDLPAVHLAEASVPNEVLNALGLEDAAWFGYSDYEYVVQVDSPKQVEDTRPDFSRILSFPVTRIAVTAPGGVGADFTSRVFVPAIGLNEDQVTGSAHAVLGPLWAARLGRNDLTAVQSSARRGELALTIAGDRVHIGGNAVIISHGDLVV